MLQNSLYQPSNFLKELMQLWELTLCDVINKKALIPLPEWLTTTANIKSVTILLFVQQVQHCSKLRSYSKLLASQSGKRASLEPAMIDNDLEIVSGDYSTHEH